MQPESLSEIINVRHMSKDIVTHYQVCAPTLMRKFFAKNLAKELAEYRHADTFSRDGRARSRLNSSKGSLRPQILEQITII